MIDMMTYVDALATIIDAALPAAATVESGQRLNADPGRCANAAWVGVYPGDYQLAPHALGGSARRWRHSGSLQVVVQRADFNDDGHAALSELEDDLRSVMAAVDADLSLGIAGVRIIGCAREYRYVEFDADGAGSIFMPQAILRFTFEIRE